MDGLEFKALLEAASRELSTLIAALPAVDTEVAGVRDALARARESTESAVASVPSARGRTAGGAEEANVQEAKVLRANAVRDRDLAEAQLWALRSERDALLERLQELTEQHARVAEKRRDISDVAVTREATLLARCEEKEEQVNVIRKSVQRKSRRLFDCSDINHRLALNQNRLERKHTDTMVENAVAKEMIELQQSCATYVENQTARRAQVEEQLNAAQQSYAQKLEDVRIGHQEQELRFAKQTEALEAKLVALDHDYEVKVQATERELQKQLEESARKLMEARAHYDKQFAELDESWSAEKAMAQAHMEEQGARTLAEREKVASELQEQFEARRAELQMTVAQERLRCEGVRRMQGERISILAEEVRHFKTLVREVQHHYRGGLRPATGSQAPRVAAPGGASVVRSEVQSLFGQGSAIQTPNAHSKAPSAAGSRLQSARRRPSLDAPLDGSRHRQ